jgi:hypothetical protein
MKINEFFHQSRCHDRGFIFSLFIGASFPFF